MKKKSIVENPFELPELSEEDIVFSAFWILLTSDVYFKPWVALDAVRLRYKYHRGLKVLTTQWHITEGIIN